VLSYLQAHFFQHQRLCACRQMWPDAVAGGVDKLVGLLDNPAGKTRAAAALALYRMSLASPEFCSNVFTSLCNAMLPWSPCTLATPQSSLLQRTCCMCAHLSAHRLDISVCKALEAQCTSVHE